MCSGLYISDLFINTSVKALEHIVYYVVLSPHNNEQWGMLNGLYIDPALLKLDAH